jgi:hypothetical protein
MGICAIEGEVILITSQNIRQRHKSPEERKTIFGETIVVFPVSIKIHGNGKIEKENACKNDQGVVVARFCRTASLKEGASIQGINLYGFSKKMMKIKKGGPARTGGHTCQYGELRDICFLCVWKSYDGTLLAPHPKTLFLA